MNIYETFERTVTNDAKWFPLSESASIQLLSVGSDKAGRAFNKMMEPYAPRLQAGGKLTDEENKALNIRFYAEHIVLDWKGLKGRDGEDIPFSKENAVKLFSDEKLQGFFMLVIRMASNEAAFEEKQAEEDEKNS